MNPELTKAIKERVEMGYSKEAIVKEFVDSGYATEIAERLYSEIVQPELLSIPKPPIQSTDTVSSAKVPEISLSQMDPAGNKIYLMVGVGFIIASAIGVFAYYAVNNMLSEPAPYTTESEMIIGVIESLRSFTVSESHMKAEMKLEPRATSTPVLENSELEEGLVELQQFGFSPPSEGYFKYSLSSLIDKRDVENIKFDSNLVVDVLFEPLIINAAGSVRLVDGSLYGKVDKIPALYEMFLGEVSLQEWVLLTEDTAELKEKLFNYGAVMPIEILLETGETPASTFAYDTLRYTEPLVSLWSTVSSRSISPEFNMKQLAGALAATFPEYDLLSAEEKQVVDKLAEPVETSPMFTFVGQPKEVTSSGELFFQYEVDVNYKNFKKYNDLLLKFEYENFSEEEKIFYGDWSSFYGEATDMFPTQSGVDIFNKMSTWTFTFTAAGEFVATRIDSVFALPIDGGDRQVRSLFEVTVNKAAESTEILVPAGVFEKSVEEMLEDSFADARKSSHKAAIKQSLGNMRSQAEISYNQNEYSYKSVCEDENIQRLFHAIQDNLLDEENVQGLVSYFYDHESVAGAVVCNDLDTSYAIMAPLNLYSDVSWCIDSTGFMGEVSPLVLESATDTTCQ